MRPEDSKRPYLLEPNYHFAYSVLHFMEPYSLPCAENCLSFSRIIILFLLCVCPQEMFCFSKGDLAMSPLGGFNLVAILIHNPKRQALGFQARPTTPDSWIIHKGWFSQPGASESQVGLSCWFLKVLFLRGQHSMGAYESSVTFWGQGSKSPPFPLRWL